MQTIEYKGFNITVSNSRYYVAAEGFNKDGYTTSSNAKGSITKWFKAQGSDEGYLQPDGTVTDNAKPEGWTKGTLPAKSASNGNKEHASVVVQESKPVMSRNQTEGRFAGLRNGKAYRVKNKKKIIPLNMSVGWNRKARKALKMADKHNYQ